MVVAYNKKEDINELAGEPGFILAMGSIIWTVYSC
jgi:hypothetical protein